MKKNFLHTTIFLSVIFLSSCAPNILGTWNVVRYETVENGQPGITLNNIGTISFDKKGVGEKKISYNVLGAQRNDSTTFTWKSNDNFVTINSDNSDFSKTWILIENSKKKQLWKATDGGNQVQILELKK
ncbi:MAG: hypothetical protein EOM47_00315 [Bacteroidia bacterium]|jgi:hypothetical protein|nr:hypothetical protein [Paludibacter sp.]MDD3488623.1 hypothetical protein [Paludibacter sp.]NCB67275.1 hypothetical protein [Bacteroidia bacterium]